MKDYRSDMKRQWIETESPIQGRVHQLIDRGQLSMTWIHKDGQQEVFVPMSDSLRVHHHPLVIPIQLKSVGECGQERNDSQDEDKEQDPVSLLSAMAIRFIHNNSFSTNTIFVFFTIYFSPR